MKKLLFLTSLSVLLFSCEKQDIKPNNQNKTYTIGMNYGGGVIVDIRYGVDFGCPSCGDRLIIAYYDTTKIFQSHNDAINYCDTLTAGGYSDWQLINNWEFDEIYNYFNREPIYNTTVFGIMQPQTNFHTLSDSIELVSKRFWLQPEQQPLILYYGDNNVFEKKFKIQTKFFSGQLYADFCEWMYGSVSELTNINPIFGHDYGALPPEVTQYPGNGTYAHTPIDWSQMYVNKIAQPYNGIAIPFRYEIIY